MQTLTLTERDRELLRQSFALVAPLADTAADVFYTRLFQVSPEVQSLFPADMSAQKQKLMQMLAFVVRSLDYADGAWRADVPSDEDLFLVMLALGCRHRDLYKVPASSYDRVGEALLWTLELCLGNAFTREARSAWATLYTLLAQTMRMGTAMSSSAVALTSGGRALAVGREQLATSAPDTEHTEHTTRTGPTVPLPDERGVHERT
jgi:hemoglobin-like flavoprotein